MEEPRRSYRVLKQEGKFAATAYTDPPWDIQEYKRGVISRRIRLLREHTSSSQIPTCRQSSTTHPNAAQVLCVFEYCYQSPDRLYPRPFLPKRQLQVKVEEESISLRAEVERLGLCGETFRIPVRYMRRMIDGIGDRGTEDLRG